MQPAILIVDDHQIYRSTLSAFIQSWWPDVFIAEAANGSQTLDLIGQHRWDLLILDYQLPTLSGGDLVRRLRARVSACGIPFPPFLLMSTQPDVTCFVRVLGAVGFLPKPVDVDELYALIAPYISEPEVPPQSGSLPQPDRAVNQDVTHKMPVLAQPYAATSSAGMPDRSALRAADVERLQAMILELFNQKVARFPPPYAPGTNMGLSSPPYRVGEYLVQLGYLTPDQLTRALRAAELADNRIPLGFTLVKQNLVPSEVIATVLLQQFRDRLRRDARMAPRFIGEQLLLQSKLTPAQLGLAVQEQLDNYKRGRLVRLEDVIARKGWLDADTLRAAMLAK
jgi:CheY-like chemotaxis protein